MLIISLTTLPLLTRLDEAQYILQPIKEESYLEIMKYFSSIENQPADSKSVEQKYSETEVQIKASGSRWWQFWKQ
ncbi:hypothetical protein H7F33_08025 [Pedobacter sp. PAMC26386]|nr:hypothetical protein H7F33_08025 [Pedobacter sp. PAMC26386]